MAKKKADKAANAENALERKRVDDCVRAKSRKKREAFLRKLGWAGPEEADERSKSRKRERGSRSRLQSEEKKLSTIEIKEAHSSKSKSPVTSRCSTPRLRQKQTPKSFNTMTQILNKQSAAVKKQTKLGKKHSSKSTKENNKLALNETDKQEKELLRKKQELERELSAINDSLTFCRKLQQRGGRGGRG